mgnify:CR=1 FL=1|tara:strand:- start:324 stop:488 length:165 start_codon:yes stop_codon:yes gene_type:complete
MKKEVCKLLNSFIKSISRKELEKNYKAKTQVRLLQSYIRDANEEKGELRFVKYR